MESKEIEKKILNVDNNDKTHKITLSYKYQKLHYKFSIIKLLKYNEINFHICIIVILKLFIWLYLTISVSLFCLDILLLLLIESE